MKQQGKECENTATRNHAINGRAFLLPPVDRITGEPAERMGPWNYTDRPIVGTTFIEVYSNCDHALQNVHWWLHVRYAFLYRPRPKSFDVSAIAHRDSQILMPRDFPVRAWRLVEQDPANGETFFAKSGFGNRSNSLRSCQFLHSGNVEEMPRAASSGSLRGG